MPELWVVEAADGQRSLHATRNAAHARADAIELLGRAACCWNLYGDPMPVEADIRKRRDAGDGPTGGCLQPA